MTVEERNNLILDHIDLVDKIVGRYYSDLDEDLIDDARSEGYIALVNAAEKHDPEKYDNFRYYAMISIRSRIGRWLTSRGLIKTPNNQSDNYVKCDCISDLSNKNRKSVRDRAFTDPSYEKVIDEMMHDHLMSIVEDALHPRCYNILMRIANGDTKSSIAKDLGLSRERVRQLGSRTIDKLIKNQLLADILTNYF